MFHKIRFRYKKFTTAGLVVPAHVSPTDASRSIPPGSPDYGVAMRGSAQVSPRYETWEAAFLHTF